MSRASVSVQRRRREPVPRCPWLVLVARASLPSLTGKGRGLVCPSGGHEVAAVPGHRQGWSRRANVLSRVLPGAPVFLTSCWGP